MSLFKRDDQPRERSAADRERARQEREARRAAREGRPIPEHLDEPLDIAEPPPPGEPVSYDEPVPVYEEPMAEEPPGEALDPEEGQTLHEASVPEPVVEPVADVVEEPEPAAIEPAPEPVIEEPEPVAAEPELEPEPPVEGQSLHEGSDPGPPLHEGSDPGPVVEPEPEPVAEDPEPEPFLSQHTQAFDPFADDEPAPVPRPEGIDQPTQGFEPLEPAPDAKASADQPTQAFDAFAAEPSPAPAPEPAPERKEWPVIPPKPADPDPTSAAPARPRFDDDDERPAPLRRVSGQARSLPPLPPAPGERKRRFGGGQGGGAGRPAPPRAPKTPNGNGGGHGKRGLVALLALFAVLAVAVWLLVSLFQPFAGGGGDPVTVQVPPNSSASQIADLLEREGVVSSAFFFKVRHRLGGGDLKAGTYRLAEGMAYGDAIDRLEAGPPPPKTVRVTIPEGRARREIAPVVEDAGVPGSYLGASERQEGFNPRRFGAPRNLASLEGFLFPATYELKPGAKAEELVSKQLDAFRENIGQVDLAKAKRRNLTTYDVLIIASMVEREAMIAKERPVIAGVIYNRLRTGMPLGIDATIRYATRNWTSPLRQSELNLDSPYNTRRRTGLPPTPIGNPGLDSIKAAANPTDTDFLFYVVKPNTCGEHAFSETDAEFQRDVEAYNDAREKAGGNSPTTC